MLQGVMVTLKNSNNIIQLIVNLCNLVILLYAGHCQQHSEVFFEFEFALSLMPYAEMSRFFKTLLMIYFLPLSDSEYLLCSISLSLLALPVTLKKRKKKARK